VGWIVIPATLKQFIFPPTSEFEIPQKPLQSSQPAMESIERKKNRWCITHTKHIKQKRKVYQDGFIDHFVITNKVTILPPLQSSLSFLPNFSASVVLFDEFEKVLECRVLKDEDTVSSGETLTFNSYLVDVGDPEGVHALPSGRDKKMQERVPSLAHRQKFRSPISSGKENIAERSSVRTSDLSPSHKVIKEFRRTELHKYEAPKNAKDTVKLGPTEWQVLYTTQVSKKAKTYHDGFLRLASCGSLQRQVMLYDTSRKLLTSRFLKKDETVAPGGSLSMDGHLVEIGEAVEDRSPLVNIPAEQRGCYANGKTRMMPERQNCSKSSTIAVEDIEGSDEQKLEGAVLSANKTTHTIKEWQVMYTSQMTQKAKKYHDGFLKLETRGSLGRQVKLYDASWNVLESRHLKKDERIRSGESVTFGAHLVDVGELKGDNELPQDSITPENDSNIGRKPGRLHNACLRPNNNKAKGNSQVDDLPRADSKSSSLTKLERTKFVETVAINQPLRDACQILSILKKPPQKSGAAGCISVDQKALASSIQVLQASPDGTSMLLPNQGASQKPTGEQLNNNKTNYFDSRKENTGICSRLPSGTEASHSSKKYGVSDVERQETTTKSSGEDFPPTSETAVTRYGESNSSEQLYIDSEELPSFDLGF
ncbi:hypothetical protein LINPERHAP2_LOCUS33442, partial [Linum perenne]